MINQPFGFFLNIRKGCNLSEILQMSKIEPSPRGLLFWRQDWRYLFFNVSGSHLAIASYHVPSSFRQSLVNVPAVPIHTRCAFTGWQAPPIPCTQHLSLRSPLPSPLPSHGRPPPACPLLQPRPAPPRTPSFPRASCLSL